jgi:hypothetical protein
MTQPSKLSSGRAWRLVRALPVALALLTVSAWPALAQTSPSGGQLTVRSDGFIFWIEDGARHVVYPTPLSDQQLNALPEGAPLNAALQPGGADLNIDASGQLSVRSDGFMFWVQDGQRHLVYPTPLADEQINALPEGVPLNASLQPGSGGPSAAVRPGSTRATRLQRGQACQCLQIRSTGQRATLQIGVADVKWDAWFDIRTTNPSNQVPRADSQYVLVTLDIKYTSGAGDLPVSVDRFDFTVLDSRNGLHVPAFVMEPQPLAGTMAYPGSEVIGQIAFQVPKDDPDPVLVWRYNDEFATWFAIR